MIRSCMLFEICVAGSGFQGHGVDVVGDLVQAYVSYGFHGQAGFVDVYHSLGHGAAGYQVENIGIRRIEVCGEAYGSPPRSIRSESRRR